MKLSIYQLRNLIKEESSRSSQIKSKGMPTITSLIFEQEEKEASDLFTGEYKGDSVDKGTNVKDVDAVEIANQLLSGDDDSPIVQAAAVGKPWIEFTGAAGKAWIEKLGPEVFVKRLNKLASKVPETGLPKPMMPFLPGPDDAKGKFEDVEDALTPGGDYNVDFEAPFKEASWKIGAQFLLEQDEEEKKEEETAAGKGGEPPTANTFVGMDASGAKEFMTAGLEDGEASDDKITIVKGGGVDAIDAIPTQSNILIYKSLGMAVNGTAGGDLEAWAGTGGEILDGHHRWAATMLNDPTANMGTAGQVDLDSLGDPKKTLKFLTAIGNALGNKTKTESVNKSNDDILLERWHKLAGLLKD